MIKKRELGKTGLLVGEVGLGCEGFAEVEPKEAIHMMDVALEHGMNYIDLYASSPITRDNIGYAIKGRRDQVIIQGHLGSVWENGQYKRTREIADTQKSFEDLLKRLDTDYIDVGMIHYSDEQTDLDTIFRGQFIDYVCQLRKEGKIKFIGISSHNPLIAKQAVMTGLIDVVMFSINPCYDMLPPSENVEDLWCDEVYEKQRFNCDPKRQELYETCERLGIGISVMKAFAGGDLLNEKLSPFGVAMTPLQCIHYCLTRPGVSVVMAGGHSAEEIRTDAYYGDATDEEKDYSNILCINPKFTFQGHCMYCGHCAPCSKEIDIASVNKFLDLCVAQGEIPETVREHYSGLGKHGGDCIACGKCEKNCPFGVAIIQKMAQAKELFGS